MYTALDDEYEFDSFLIGTSLATQFLEREDEVRAKFKIRGTMSIKNHITNAVRNKFRTLTSAREKFEKPDLVIILNIFSDKTYSFTAKSKSIVAAGRYTKNQRGVSQRRPKAEEFNTRLDDDSLNCKSIEGIISDKVIADTKGSDVRFSWVGSEDKNSLVLGRGRPFFVEILNPKKRTFSNNTLIISESEIHARLDILDEGFPRSLTRSRTVTKILIHCSESLSEKDLKQLDSLAGSTVKLKNRFSSTEKKIYSVLVDRINRSQFYLTTIADSGLPIKQFVGGIEYANPNISMLIGSNCECISFDILDVIIQ